LAVSHLQDKWTPKIVPDSIKTATNKKPASLSYKAFPLPDTEPHHCSLGSKKNKKEAGC
jgi:hypothetical protein